MIKEERCYYIQCDKSEDIYEDADGFSLFPEKEELIELAQEDGWREIDGKWYSPEFVGFDPDKDEYVVLD